MKSHTFILANYSELSLKVFAWHYLYTCNWVLGKTLHATCKGIYNCCNKIKQGRIYTIHWFLLLLLSLFTYNSSNKNLIFNIIYNQISFMRKSRILCCKIKQYWRWNLYELRTTFRKPTSSLYILNFALTFTIKYLFSSK